MQQSPAFAGEANLPHSQLMRYFGTRIGMKPVPRMFCLGLLLLWTWNLVGCTVPNRKRDIPQVKLTIQNTLPIKRESVPIVLALDELKQIASDFSFDAYLVGQPPREIHSQADDTNYDGQRDELVFLGKEISEQRDYGNTVADQIDLEVQTLIESSYDTARNLLLGNQDKLTQIALYLIEHETVEGEELNKLFAYPVTKGK